MSSSFLFLVLGVFILGVQSLSPNDRAKALVAEMSLAQKIHMVSGDLYLPYIPLFYTGHITGDATLGIPTLNFQDGPQGVGDEAFLVTCWPSAVTVAASWDTALMYEFGQSTGAEQRGKGTNVVLGPMVNIARVPYSGRTYEGFGEDTYLVTQMGVAAITGIQSQGVIAVVKHWVNNEQETNRQTVTANVDERTEWEVYYPPFQAAVNAGVGAVMCSYNKINGTWGCENEGTLTRDLKGTMGFNGFVISDWLATHTTSNAANNGLDLEMPLPIYFGLLLETDVVFNVVKIGRLNDMVTRILTSVIAAGLVDNAQTGDLTVDVQSLNHTLQARALAAAGTVLLQNTGNLLPLSASALSTIAVIGDDASDSPVYEGSGSGSVIAPYVITPLAGIKARAPGVSVSYTNSANTTAAAAAAAAAQVAIVFVSVQEAEGTDRANLSLDGNGDALVAAVAAANPNTVVVLHVPGATLLPWASSVKSILSAFYPGQENGNAIASILFGDVNPSGRLPMTFPAKETDTPLSTPLQYPGVNLVTNYTEALLVGYKWFDQQNVAPLFPFGHGLSYTTFTYSNLAVTAVNSTTRQVTLNVLNSGLVDGSEVVQLYLGFPAAAGEPPKLLRGFKKIALPAGAQTSVQFTLVANDFSVWDVPSHNYLVFSGTFTIYVGASSRDIRLTTTTTL